MLAFLLNIDAEILRCFNVRLAYPWLDSFWLIVTHLDRQLLFKYIFLPALLLWALSIYKGQLIPVMLALGLTVGLTDVLAYRGIKAFVQRPRPSENLEIASWLRPIGDAQGPSFPSNHAANCFAGAGIMSWYFYRRRYLFYTLATLVAVSRVALGVHYPSDVVAGAILGFGVALVIRTSLLNASRGFWHGPNQRSMRVDFPQWRIRSRRINNS